MNRFVAWLQRKLLGIVSVDDLETDLRTENRTVKGFGYKFMLFKVRKKNMVTYHWWAEPVMPYVSVFRTSDKPGIMQDLNLPMEVPTSFTLDSQQWKEFVSKPMTKRTTLNEDRMLESLVKYIGDFIDKRVEDERNRLQGIGKRKGFPRDDEKYKV